MATPPQTKNAGGAHVIKRRERQAKALELRKAGATYKQIAEQLGYSSPQSVAATIKSALDRMIREPAEELRQMEYERLNHILLTLWPRVQAGELAAVDRAMRVMDRIEALMGLHMQTPTSVQQTNVIMIDGKQDEYVKGLMEIRQKMLANAPHNDNVEVIELSEDDVSEVNGTQ